MLNGMLSQPLPGKSSMTECNGNSKEGGHQAARQGNLWWEQADWDFTFSNANLEMLKFKFHLHTPICFDFPQNPRLPSSGPV
jgi:hypothetical protein